LPERLRTIQDDHDNVRRAFEWLLAHDREQALSLVAQLGTELNFWELGGFFQEGRRWLQRALEGTQGSVSIQRGHAYSFELLAQVNESEKRYEQAVQLWAAAETLRVRIGAPLEQVAQKHGMAALARVRAQLGDVVFELEWSKGATMATEQAITLALS